MNTPTPRTDVAENILQNPWRFARQLERELTAAREEITLLKTNLKIQTNHTENAVQDRADEHIELHNQIHELTEQLENTQAELLKSCIRERLRNEDYKYQKERADDAGFMLIEANEQRDEFKSHAETAINDHEMSEIRNYKLTGQLDELENKLEKSKAYKNVMKRDNAKLRKQRDEARKLAERYRNLSCKSQEEADETLLPWENNQTTEP